MSLEFVALQFYNSLLFYFNIMTGTARYENKASELSEEEWDSLLYTPRMLYSKLMILSLNINNLHRSD